ncbi:MAG: 3-hydroxybutyryl-CoA dehydrogenase [Rhodobacteraceae bacterium]|nr:MAG: 3-hydroxybutyryl-CoA dehydrogenase [Paracoccaceae bacterium]
MGAREVIASVGAGRMGRGMAIAFAFAGHRVFVIDAKPRPALGFAALEQAATTEMRDTFAMLAGFGMLESGEIDAMMARISVIALGDCAAPLAQSDVIFEAVPEVIDAKRTAFATICQHTRTDAIIASTTSTILSDDLQGFVSHPGRFLNAHWLNPAFLVPLVELSPGKLTEKAATDRLKALLEKIGKVPVVCAASPGYIVPRIQALAMNEAARIVEEGVASAEDVDKATKYGFGFRFAVLGLPEFIDWGGGDILYHASNYMVRATGQDRFAAPQIIRDNMENGRNGLRDGKGFLSYEGLDIPAYQRDRLAGFVAMLRHLDKMPPKG